MAWGSVWPVMSKEELIKASSEMLKHQSIFNEMLNKITPKARLTSFDLVKGTKTFQIETDNLIFICDKCETVFDPGISGF